MTGKTHIVILILQLIFVFNSCRTSQQPYPADRENETVSVVKKVVSWQKKHFTYKKEGNLHDYGIDAWTNAVLYLGMEEWANTINDKSLYTWLYSIGKKNHWQIPANFKDNSKYRLYHADELCIGQFYLNMYRKYGEEKMLHSVKERADWIISNPSDDNMSYKNKQTWTWCDALFMAPPVYLKLNSITGDSIYFKFMDKHFKASYNHLYDSDEGLFFRDDSYFGKKEDNGEKIFWGRGNGWVAAGLANILKLLPGTSEYRPFYEDLFIKLCSKLAGMQNRDGFWHASLSDPQNYPSPETSATALITYALLYGINESLLDQETYLPIAMKSWDALNSVIDLKGKLGWVQPIGADPKKVTEDMTAVYGVGAFLLAATEIYKLQNK